MYALFIKQSKRCPHFLSGFPVSNILRILRSDTQIPGENLEISRHHYFVGSLYIKGGVIPPSPDYLGCWFQIFLGSHLTDETNQAKNVMLFSTKWSKHVAYPLNYFLSNFQKVAHNKTIIDWLTHEFQIYVRLNADSATASTYRHNMPTIISFEGNVRESTES